MRHQRAAPLCAPFVDDDDSREPWAFHRQDTSVKPVALDSLDPRYVADARAGKLPARLSAILEATKMTEFIGQVTSHLRRIAIAELVAANGVPFAAEGFTPVAPEEVDTPLFARVPTRLNLELPLTHVSVQELKAITDDITASELVFRESYDAATRRIAEFYSSINVPLAAFCPMCSVTAHDLAPLPTSSFVDRMELPAIALVVTEIQAILSNPRYCSMPLTISRASTTFNTVVVPWLTHDELNVFSCVRDRYGTEALMMSADKIEQHVKHHQSREVGMAIAMDDLVMSSSEIMRSTHENIEANGVTSANINILKTMAGILFNADRAQRGTAPGTGAGSGGGATATGALQDAEVAQIGRPTQKRARTK